MRSARQMGWDKKTSERRVRSSGALDPLEETLCQKLKKQMLEPLLSTLEDLLKWFESTKTKGVIIGGVAASFFWETPRDAGCRLGYCGPIRISQSRNSSKQVKKFGFIPRLSNAIEFAERRSILLMRHQKDNTDVDLSLGYMPFDQEVFERAGSVKLLGMGSRSAPEDLIIMKAIPRRIEISPISNLYWTLILILISKEFANGWLNFHE